MLPGFARMAQITRAEQSGLVSPFPNFPHYFPLSYLSDLFWDNVNAVNPLAPIIRVTDQYMQEVPFQVIDFNSTTKTGALWFKGGVDQDAKAWYIHWETTTEPAYDYDDTFGSVNVWTAFRDAVLLNENPADVFFVNSKIGIASGTYAGTPTGNHIAGPLEMKANHFKDSADNSVIFSAPTFDNLVSAVTFVFCFRPTKVTGGIKHLFGNWRSGFTGQQPWRVVLAAGPSLGLELGESGLGWYNLTLSGEMDDVALNTWYQAAILYPTNLGTVELDINGVARLMEEGQSLTPADSNSATRTVGGLGSAGSDCGLSAILVYNGSLVKSQRDLFYDNWMNPETFWSVNMLTGALVCVESQIDEVECVNTKIPS